MTQEIFIYCAEHDEHGSERVSVYFSEDDFRAAIGDCDDDVDGLLANARLRNGASTEYIDRHNGWGGPHIFICKKETR